MLLYVYFSKYFSTNIKILTICFLFVNEHITTENVNRVFADNNIQGQIDLHGYGRAEAETAVQDFIIRMSRLRSCCIKIIHGRGINSPAEGATLKAGLQRLLATRRMSRYVVAYASAPSRYGGVGAVYVLLRTPR